MVFCLGNSRVCNHTPLQRLRPIAAEGVLVVVAQVVEGGAAVTIAEDAVDIIHINVVSDSISSVT